MQERTADRSPPYQVCHHLLHVLGALLHLIFGTSKLDDVTFVRRVWEVDDNLQEAVIYSKLKQMQELLCQTCKSWGDPTHPFSHSEKGNHVSSLWPKELSSHTY